MIPDGSPLNPTRLSVVKDKKGRMKLARGRARVDKTGDGWRDGIHYGDIRLDAKKKAKRATGKAGAKPGRTGAKADTSVRIAVQKSAFDKLLEKIPQYTGRGKTVKYITKELL